MNNNNRVPHHYGAEFNTNAAEAMAPFILSITQPKSVVDVGCGIGTWLKVFSKIGVKDVVGIDGIHVADSFQLDRSHFVPVDFEDSATVGALSVRLKKFDLAICLEVAEHLTPEAGQRLVEFLTTVSDVIVFSAAIPGQTGENHINEQYPDYWRQSFNELGFTFYDPFRSKFWNDSSIEWWYRQSMFLVIRSNSKKDQSLKEWDGNTYVHPELLEMYVRRNNIITNPINLGYKALLKSLVQTLLRNIHTTARFTRIHR